ncbi:MAG TPA: hypothetical protein VNI52_02135 [Sphingobacteriaceae bacterium]|nr:hypothetical protein [Sphingobacteriaceae bacterium]
MKEWVDKKLKERIIEAFDSYEDSDVEKGWQQLRKTHPKKRSKRILFWWTSAAALLAMLGTFLILNPADQDIQKQITKNKIKPVSEDTINGRTDLIVKKRVELNKDSSNGIAFPSSDKNPEQLGNHINSNELIAAIPAKEPLKAESGYNSVRQAPPSPATIVEVRVSSKVNAFENSDKTTEQPGKQVDPAQASSVTMVEKERLQEADSINKAIMAQSIPGIITDEKVSLQTHTDDSVKQENAVADDNKISESHTFSQRGDSQALPEDETVRQEKEASNNKKLGLSFYAGPFFNYAQGSGNSMNLGAGVTSDISLGKRLTLITGLAIAKNTLIYGNKLPVASNRDFLFSQQDRSTSTGSISQISKLEAQLLNLDIPVNLKYSISREPNKVFITAGLSSFTYLNETYRYSYTSQNKSLGISSPSRDEVINKNFGKFDLAQTLNMSFGLTNSGKFQDFVFEPFIKYPLGALGSQNIRFGSAGINLKLNIKPSKN